jgi:hypothetical protein
MSPSRSAAGPAWLWITAWSFQGLALLGVEALRIESPTARFLVSGALAAIPLVGLYLALHRRARSRNVADSPDT